MAMVCKGQINAERLPPSPRAAIFHGFRVHLQTISWKTLDDPENQLKPDDWGWKLGNNNYVPITTDEVVAPDNLLKIVRCNCTENCSTNRCTCKRNQLKCTSTCGNCYGKNCENAEVFLFVL